MLFALSAHVAVDRQTPANYTIPCPDCGTNVDYTEPMIRDTVSQGLADKDIQLELLGDANQSPSLEEVLQFVEKKESPANGQHLDSQPHPPQQAAHTGDSNGDQLKTNKPQAQAGQPPDTSDPCMYCGKHGQGTKASARIYIHPQQTMPCLWSNMMEVQHQKPLLWLDVQRQTT